MKGELHPLDAERLSIGGRLDGQVLTEAIAEKKFRLRMATVSFMAGSGVIPVGVSDQGLIDGPDRVDVNPCARAMDPGCAEFEESHRRRNS
jgi:hypothetical protein